MVRGYARGRAIKMSLLAMLGVAMLVGVGILALDMHERASRLPMGPGFGPWVCAIIGGLPALLVFLYGVVAAAEQRGGGPDARFLRDRWQDIRAVHTHHVTYTMKGGAVGTTTEVIITLNDGEKAALTLPSSAAEQVRTHIAAELMMRR